MRKEIFHKITSILLLVIILVPISLQFIHAFEAHTFQKNHTEGIDIIQDIEKDCAIFHQQINHNVINLNFDFELKNILFYNEDILILISETVQTFTEQKSSRAPPISIV